MAGWLTLKSLIGPLCVSLMLSLFAPKSGVWVAALTALPEFGLTLLVVGCYGLDIDRDEAPRLALLLYGAPAPHATHAPVATIR
jgi:hypothetical protein